MAGVVAGLILFILALIIWVKRPAPGLNAQSTVTQPGVETRTGLSIGETGSTRASAENKTTTIHK